MKLTEERGQDNPESAGIHGVTEKTPYEVEESPLRCWFGAREQNAVTTAFVGATCRSPATPQSSTTIWLP